MCKSTRKSCSFKNGNDCKSLMSREVLLWPSRIGGKIEDENATMETGMMLMMMMLVEE